jgi:hypothetical protein
MAANAIEPFAKCIAAPSCGGDSACEREAASVIAGQNAIDYGPLCKSKRAECKKSFSDVCGDDVYLYEGAGESLRECLKKPCDQIQACVAPVIKSLTDVCP